MAKLIREDNFDGKIETEEREVEENDNDNSDLIDKAEELGVAFGCQDGRCGSCRVEVIEGMKNLTDKTRNEDDVLGSAVNEDSKNYRLLCQCKVKHGLVKIRI